MRKFGVLQERDDFEVTGVTSGSQGQFKEITFSQALMISGMQLFSDKRGNYALDSRPPNFFWDGVTTPPSGLKFLFNRKLKVVRGVRAGKLMFNVRVDFT